jgi:poly(A) polymerase
MDQASDLLTSEIFTIIQEKLQNTANVYLVGGAIRDVLLSRPIHDMDFVVLKDAGKVAKKLADDLKGGFYMLDEERDIARVVIDQPNGKKFYLDFSALREENLFKDLRSRDFTINAMAVNVAQPELLIDPLKGIEDIKAGFLQICNPNSFRNDPIRVVRAVRMAIQFDLKITENTLHALKEQVKSLDSISQERIRDELFRILESEKIASALRLLDQLGIIDTLWPELSALKSIEYENMANQNVWQHTLATVQGLEDIWRVLVGEYTEEKGSNLWLGTLVGRLGRYRTDFDHHFQLSINPLRSRKAQLFYTALFHDCGKPAVQLSNETGQVSYLGHDTAAEAIVRDASRKIRLSENEVTAITLMVKEHMRFNQLGKNGVLPDNREIHYYYKKNRSYGIDLCFLALANTIGTYQHALDQDVWLEKVNLARVLMEAYFEKYEQVVNPTKIVSGSEIMKQFNIEPGKQVGELLEELQAAQAEGKVSTKSEAISYLRAKVKSV